MTTFVNSQRQRNVRTFLAVCLFFSVEVAEGNLTKYGCMLSVDYALAVCLLATMQVQGELRRRQHRSFSSVQFGSADQQGI